MINIMLTGVGGQGTVLAAKVLAVAAAQKGWKVRTAETIGMAQRGGSVVSHVRIGNLGEPVHGPLVTHGCADLIIAFEPGEAARILPYLSKTGTIVTATTPIEPVSASLSDQSYSVQQIIDEIRISLYNVMVKNITRGKARGTGQAQLIPIDDAAILRRAECSRKVLNSVMLAVACVYSGIPISIKEIEHAIEACVKPQYVQMNLEAIQATLEMLPPEQKEIAERESIVETKDDTSRPVARPFASYSSNSRIGNEITGLSADQGGSRVDRTPSRSVGSHTGSQSANDRASVVQQSVGQTSQKSQMSETSSPVKATQNPSVSQIDDAAEGQQEPAKRIQKQSLSALSNNTTHIDYNSNLQNN